MHSDVLERVHTCAKGGIALTAGGRAGHHFAGDVAILVISGARARLTGLGSARYHPSAAGRIGAAKSQIEGGWHCAGVELQPRSRVLGEAGAS